jgi:hypothetical protein
LWRMTGHWKRLMRDHQFIRLQTVVFPAAYGWAL